MKLPVTLIALLALPGCAGFGQQQNTGERSPQDYAGCTMVQYTAADGGVVDWKDCKDKAMVTAALTMPGGVNFSYNADDVTGLEHMRLRAEVDKALTGAGVEVTAAVIDAVIGVLRANRAP